MTNVNEKKNTKYKKAKKQKKQNKRKRNKIAVNLIDPTVGQSRGIKGRFECISTLQFTGPATNTDECSNNQWNVESNGPSHIFVHVDGKATGTTNANKYSARSITGTTLYTNTPNANITWLCGFGNADTPGTICVL